MAAKCGVCHEQDSKYKCPVCELKYCSIACYKSHKTAHENGESTLKTASQPPLRDRPGTTQRVPKVDFTGVEKDKEMQRLLIRYPLLKVQLQAAYALTLEPGPDEARSWNRESLPGFEQPVDTHQRRGRGRGARVGRGGLGRGGRDLPVPEERQRGPWTQTKGNKEALDVIKRMREGERDDDEAEGLREFITLCQIKFGVKSEGG